MAGVHHRGGACIWRRVPRVCASFLATKNNFLRVADQNVTWTLQVKKREGDRVEGKLKQISNLSGCCGARVEGVREQGLKENRTPKRERVGVSYEPRGVGEMWERKSTTTTTTMPAYARSSDRVWITSSSSPDWKWKPPNGGNDIKPVTPLKFPPPSALLPSFNPFLPSTFLCFLVDWSDSNYRRTRERNSASHSSSLHGKEVMDGRWTFE